LLLFLEKTTEEATKSTVKNMKMAGKGRVIKIVRSPWDMRSDCRNASSQIAERM
jgi:hypothetical protein